MWLKKQKREKMCTIMKIDKSNQNIPLNDIPYKYNIYII